MDEAPSSLAEQRQNLTRLRIRRAAMDVVARRGFDATVEEIAQLSGVSPRTIFRHYKSHDCLIVATVKDMWKPVGRGRSKTCPIRVTTSMAGSTGWHGRSTRETREIIGDAFWDIHAPSHKDSEVLAEVPGLRREYRVRGVGYLAALAWRTAGGTGEPPETLTLAFALHFSAFATQALMIDFDQTPAEVGVLTAELLKAALARALQAQSVDQSSVATEAGRGED